MDNAATARGSHVPDETKMTEATTATKPSGEAFLPEIEGLRAVALLGVLVFHARADWSPHGYLGVDAFFVLSGFLITRLLLTECDDHGKVDVAKFYIRRVRRLFPTLALVIILTLIAGWFVLLPYELEELAPSAVAATLSFSNFFFWSKEGYFNLASEQKPLLHTWSLGVEEQFYLIWPWLVPALALRAGRKNMRIVLALLGLLSLAGALYFSGDLGMSGALLNLDRGSDTFYLPWWRVFEFVAGALLAGHAIALPARIAATAGALGMSLLVGVMFSNIESPQILREFLTCVSIMLIVLGQGHGPVGRLLRTGPVRWLGRVSYSAYLWHWPLLVYARKALRQDLSNSATSVVVIATFLLAWASHHHVEQRFRKLTPGKPNRRFLLHCGFAALGTAGMAFAVHANAGRSWMRSDKPSPTLAAQLQQPRDKLLEYNLLVERDAPRRFAGNGHQKLLVLGDSQAADFVNVLKESGELLDLAFHHTSAKCQVMYGIDFARFSDQLPPKFLKSCEKDHADLQKLALVEQADAVLVSMAFRPWVVPFIEEIQSNLEAKGPRVLLLGPKKLEQLGLDFAARHFHEPPAVRDRAFRMLDATLEVDKDLRQRLKGSRYLSLLDLLCNKPGECPPLTPYGASIYSDEMHFTQEGARWLAPRFLRHPIVIELLKSRRSAPK